MSDSLLKSKLDNKEILKKKEYRYKKKRLEEPCRSERKSVHDRAGLLSKYIYIHVVVCLSLWFPLCFIAVMFGFSANEDFFCAFCIVVCINQKRNCISNNMSCMFILYIYFNHMCIYIQFKYVPVFALTLTEFSFTVLMTYIKQTFNLCTNYHYICMLCSLYICLS